MAARVKRINGIIIEVVDLEPVPCLGHCYQKFKPEFVGQRICPACARQNESINGREYKLGRAE